MTMQNWLDKNDLHRWEGDQGVESLEKVLRKIGYKPDGFLYGTLTERFLTDNPGAIEKLLEFIEEYFEEKFESDTDESEEDEDDE